MEKLYHVSIMPVTQPNPMKLMSPILPCCGDRSCAASVEWPLPTTRCLLCQAKSCCRKPFTTPNSSPPAVKREAVHHQLGGTRHLCHPCSPPPPPPSQTSIICSLIIVKCSPLYSFSSSSYIFPVLFKDKSSKLRPKSFH